MEKSADLFFEMESDFNVFIVKYVCETVAFLYKFD